MPEKPREQDDPEFWQLRRERDEELKQALTIEHAPKGEYRYVVLNGIALGRLRRDEDTGNFLLEWLSDWRAYRFEFGGPDFEHAEGWAVETIASLFAKGEQARRMHG